MSESDRITQLAALVGRLSEKVTALQAEVTRLDAINQDAARREWHDMRYGPM